MLLKFIEGLPEDMTVSFHTSDDGTVKVHMTKQDLAIRSQVTLKEVILRATTKEQLLVRKMALLKSELTRAIEQRGTEEE